MLEQELNNQDTQGFLKDNLPIIDEEILEIYSILETNHPEILYVGNFDVPKEQLDYYCARHFEIYSQKADEILKDLPNSLVLSSGMFGGKTTLSFLILDRLLEKKAEVALLIADVMGEDYITARSYKGEHKRDAVRFGDMTDYRETIAKLAYSDVEVIFLDEFSFLNLKIVEDLQEMCLQEKKSLILTGLNKSYLGQALPAFCFNSKIIQNSEITECYSFVPGFCDVEPLGTSTIRYVKIQDKWILDFGLLPLVVSKEKSHVVHYAPAMGEHTAVEILKNNPDLLTKILFPTEDKLCNQNSLLHRLECSA